MVALRPVDYSNAWKITRLCVESGQRHFVASNADSLIEAYITIAVEHGVALPFGVYDGDTPVGFVMIGEANRAHPNSPQEPQFCV